jgi:hypothetical protein
MFLTWAQALSSHNWGQCCDFCLIAAETFGEKMAFLTQIAAIWVGKLSQHCFFKKNAIFFAKTLQK